ncbi:MAG: VCBS repeat-containing protein, partial [Planctomycetota bacterium]
MQPKNSFRPIRVLSRIAGRAQQRQFTFNAQMVETLEQRMLLSADFPGASNEFGRAPVLSVVHADFDGDTIQDAAVSLDLLNTSSGRVVVLKGAGDTSFDPTGDELAVSGSNAHELLAMDLNGDGAVDLAAVADHFVAIAFNDGTGAFSAWETTSLRNDEPGTAIAGGDLDGDNDTDLIIGDGYGGLTVFVNDGAGGFTRGDRYDANDSRHADIAEIRDVELNDFDEDGTLDIVAVTGDESGNQESQRSKITTWTGDGDATFTFHCDFRTPDRPVDVEIADITGDGFGDFIVLNNPDPRRSEQRLTIWTGGDGDVFTARGSIDRGLVARGASLEAGNLDNGPIEELVVGDGYGQIVVLDQYNAHTNTFNQLERFRVGETAADVELVDLNGDGMLDALIGDGYGDLIALEGLGGSSFNDRIETPGSETPEPHLDAFAIANGDYDGDGDVDIFVSSTAAERAYVLFNDGNANFLSGPVFSIGRGVEQVVAGDLNGDGIDDVVIQAEKSFVNGVRGAVQVLLSNGDGTFTAHDLGVPSVDTVGLGDFNGDGALDIAAARDGTDDVSIFRGNGDGTFQDRMVVDAGRNSHGYLATGDLNNDGFDDIVVAS